MPYSIYVRKQTFSLYVATVLFGGFSKAMSSARIRFRSFDSRRVFRDLAIELIRCQQVELVLFSSRASAASCSSTRRSSRRSATSARHCAYLRTRTVKLVNKMLLNNSQWDCLAVRAAAIRVKHELSASHLRIILEHIQ